MTLREVVLALFGAYRLARFDALGMSYFDTSITGFWRSFTAAVLVAPLYFTTLLGQILAGEIDAALPRFFAVHAIGYVVMWVAYPLLMIAVTSFLDRDHKYLGYIVAYNWAVVWQWLIMVPITLLGKAGVLPPGLDMILHIAVLSYVAAYVWFVAKEALEIPGLFAATIVAGDFLLSVFILIIIAEMVVQPL